ncbi:MAG: methyltransferase domain-containing protein [Acidimicrobiia bacterium]|nr:methyltransferase domain-containing protein [Acidimicrobiia bacterium]
MSDAEAWSASFGSDASAVYAETLLPTVFVPWAGDLLDVLMVGPGQRLLDVACGPGTLAAVAATRIGSTGAVTGVDPSDTMLDLARRIELVDGAAPVAWLRGPADDIALPTGSFDVVACQQGVQFFPDRRAALVEMRRVCRGGGRMGFSVWRPIDECPSFRAVAAGLSEALGADAADAYRGGPWGWTDPAAMTEVTEGAGFIDVQAVARTLSVRFHSVEQLAATVGAAPVGAQLDASPSEVRRAFLDATAAAIQPFLRGTAVVAPTATTVVTARSPGW